MKKLFLSILLVLISYAAIAQQTPVAHTTTGTLQGAVYRVDAPDKWNGVLLIYFHGYSMIDRPVDVNTPDPLASGLAGLGYLVAQSSYSQTGWAVEQALPETEALRQKLVQQYKPRETYVMGHSLGGLLTEATIEQHPDEYDGALALCGALGPSTILFGRAGAIAAAIQYYYPGIVPGPVDVPASYHVDDALLASIGRTLPTNPTGMAELMALGHLKQPEDLVFGIAFGAFVLGDLQRRAGGPTIDNQNFIYTGGPDDNALNAGVKRYTASAAARAYLNRWYTPSGKLTRPMLAVHTTYDPTVPPDLPLLYADQVQREGDSRNFVQQLVPHDGHCQITPEETVTALDELLNWKRNGVRPAAGPVPAAVQATAAAR